MIECCFYSDAQGCSRGSRMDAEVFAKKEEIMPNLLNKPRRSQNSRSDTHATSVVSGACTKVIAFGEEFIGKIDTIDRAIKKNAKQTPTLANGFAQGNGSNREECKGFLGRMVSETKVLKGTLDGRLGNRDGNAVRGQ